MFHLLLVLGAMGLSTLIQQGCDSEREPKAKRERDEDREQERGDDEERRRPKSAHKNEVEKLAREFTHIRCSRGTSMDQARTAELRTQEIIKRMKEIRDELSDSIEQQGVEQQILRLIQTECSSSSVSSTESPDLESPSMKLYSR